MSSRRFQAFRSGPAGRRLFAAFVALLAWLAAAAVQAGEDFSVREIAPGVWVHAGEIAPMSAANEGGIANIGFIVGESGVAVVDTGGSVAEGAKLLAAIRKATDKPILFVINTHEHPDHIFGNAAFEGTGAAFVGHRNLPRAIADRADFYRKAFTPILGEALMKDVKLLPPTLTVEGGRALDLGGRVIDLRAWPVAHTDCDLTVFDRTTRTLFAGDLVFVGHIPIVDGSLKGWIAALDALAALPASRVVPGHGPPVADWPAALEPERTYLRRLAGDLSALIARGDPVGKAAAEAGKSERDKWQLFDDYNGRNATAAFAELEWDQP